jgi:hypothetical protein
VERMLTPDTRILLSSSSADDSSDSVLSEFANFLEGRPFHSRDAGADCGRVGRPLSPLYLGSALASGYRITGPYETPAMSVEVLGVFTNKSPTGAYRRTGGRRPLSVWNAR